MTKFNDGIPVGSRFTSRLVRTDTSAFLDVDINGYGVPPASFTPNASFEIFRTARTFTTAAAPYSAVLRARNFSGFSVTEPAGDTNIDDRTQKDITFFWDFGDPSYTPRLTPNIPTAWRNVNVASGKQVAHVWNSPATYTVTCYAFDNAGNWGVATHEVIVASRNDVHPTTQTICWNPPSDTDYTGAPSGAATVNTVSALNSAINGLAVGITPRILLKRGATYTNPSATIGARNRSLFVSHYGSAPSAPKVSITNGSGVFFMRDSAELVVDGIDFEGTYRANTDTGQIGSVFGGNLSTFVTRTLYNRCRFVGFYPTPWPNNTNANGAYALADTLITDWKDYGAGNTNSLDGIFFIGSDIAQNVDALGGNSGVAGDQQTQGFQLGLPHGPWRGNTNDTFFSCTSFFSRAGWFAAGNATTTAPGHDQGCVRFWQTFPGNPASEVLPRQHHVWERCTFEGGDGQIALSNTANSAARRPLNHVIDKIIVAGTSRSYGGFMGGNQAGVVLRNAMFYMKNQALHTSNTREGFDVGFTCNTETGAPITTPLPPVEIYNCTILNNLPSGELAIYPGPIGLPAAQTSVNVNNVIQVPNRAPWQGTAFSPLGSIPIEGFTLRDKGARWNFPPIGGRSLPAGLLAVGDFREGGAGPVANGEWIAVDYPNYTGYCRGNNANGPFTAQLTQAQVLANSTQFHRISVRSEAEKGMAPAAAGGSGRVVFDFTSTKIRVQNNTGVTWPTTTTQPDTSTGPNHFQIALDLSDYLMNFVSGTGQFGETVPAPRPLAGSSALSTGNTTPRSQDDFFGTRKPGSRTNTGTIVPGLASQGAFEP